MMLSASAPQLLAGGSAIGNSHSSTRGLTDNPVNIMAGTKTTASTHSDGSSRRSRRPTAAGPTRVSDAAISEPASANITDMAGKTRVRVAQSGDVVDHDADDGQGTEQIEVPVAHQPALGRGRGAELPYPAWRPHQTTATRPNVNIPDCPTEGDRAAGTGTADEVGQKPSLRSCFGSRCQSLATRTCRSR